MANKLRVRAEIETARGEKISETDGSHDSLRGSSGTVAAVIMASVGPGRGVESLERPSGPSTWTTSDYFAELFVAGRFADAGWNIYFPHRDQGFDFIVSRPYGPDGQIIRPAQVKGKYPTSEKTDKDAYGYVGELSQVHPEMVLAIPFFCRGAGESPRCVAYLPFRQIRRHVRGYRCQPARFEAGVPIPRRSFARYFDAGGLDLVRDPRWSVEELGR
jgi:hypothetical protein